MSDQLTYVEFIALLPEFSAKTAIEVEPQLFIAFTESNGYPGLCREELQDYCQALLAAHYLTIVDLGIQQNNTVKRYQSRNDEIEYHSNLKLGDYSSTQYGQRLDNLLKSNYCGGYVSECS